MATLTACGFDGEEPDHRSDQDAGPPDPNRTDLFEIWADETPTVPLLVVRLDQSESIVVPFTSKITEAKLHYCEEPEIRGYLTCNGRKCVICRVGRQVDVRALLPVYHPATQSIAVLPISSSSRPGALRPQLLPILRSGRRVAIAIRKPDRAVFLVSEIELRDGMDDGARIVKDFLDRWRDSKVDLASVYPRYDNAVLAAVPAIAAILRFKGIDPDDLD
jgi:hypothetical protein